MAIGYTRLKENSDATQTFNITIFYPLDEEKPCYVSRLKEGQVLSIANSKFAIGSSDNQIDVSNSICFKYYFYLVNYN